MTAPLTILTNSRRACYRACQRQHYYKYEQGYRPCLESEPLHFGTLGHHGLEAWWLAAEASAGPDARLAAANSAMAPEADPFTRAKASVLLAGYTERWASFECDVLGVEVEFTCPLVNPDTGAASRLWTLAGKLDAVVKDRQGRILILEHKFSGLDISPGSNYWRRLKLDPQISAYYDGARALYGDVWGCLYDVIGKPDIRPLKATPPESRKYTKDGRLYASQREEDETPEQFTERLVAKVAEDPARYYQRGEVVRLEQDMKDAQFDVWQTAKSMRDSERLNRWPRNPDACARYSRSCDYLAVCCGEASLDDPMLYRRLDSVNPELSLREES